MVSDILLFSLFARFVSETCRNLREHKSYLVYTAVACLGVAALCDLIKEVIYITDAYYKTFLWKKTRK